MKRPYGSTATWSAKSSERIFPSSIYRNTFPRGSPARQLEHAVAEVHWRDKGWRVLKNGTRWATVISTALCDERGCLHGFAIVTRDDKGHKSTVEVLLLACDLSGPIST